VERHRNSRVTVEGDREDLARGDRRTGPADQILSTGLLGRGTLTASIDRGADSEGVLPGQLVGGVDGLTRVTSLE